MVLRWALMGVAAWLLVVALGATAAESQPSAVRLIVAGVLACLAPLFWPGNAATPARTAARVGLWSAAAAGLAAATMWGVGGRTQAVAQVVMACAVLALILLLAHAATAALESAWRGPAGDSDSAREAAGRTVAVAVLLAGALPLWLGPVGELLSVREPWLIDAVVGISPLTHLAVASDNDLLRNEWLYQYSNLASLPVSYPGLATVAGSYAATCLVLAALAWWHRQRTRRISAATNLLEKHTP